ncbi:Uncharacterised protein [Yersinia enterocolitica]|nr:Uncharacterised protein [Yersinia enterocolitica]
MRIARGHIALGFYNTGCQQGFLFVSEHAIAAVLHRLTTPPRAQPVQDRFVFFTDGETGTRAVGQLVNFTLNPAHRVFREDRRGPQLTSLITND